MKPAMFEMSADTRLLRQALTKTKVGEIATYATLSSEISKLVSGGLPALQSAKSSLLRQDRIVFETVRGVGLKRLSDSDIVAASDADAKAIRRKAKTAAIKITSVADYAGLTPALQLQHTIKLSSFAAVSGIFSSSGQTKIEKVATGRSGELPIAETLKAFAA